MNDILYYCLLLDDESKRLLSESFKKYIPEENWNPKEYCHHMTILFKNDFDKRPDLVDYCQKNNGKVFSAACIGLGISDKAMAVEVSTVVPSNNSRKHITLYTNTLGNGKPFESNLIKSWTPCGETIVVRGRITAIGRS